jgi:hypothetical protein
MVPVKQKTKRFNGINLDGEDRLDGNVMLKAESK